jgi:hypothetical protein
MVAATDTITVNFSPSLSARACIYRAFRGIEEIALNANSVSGTGATYNSALTATASVASGDLCIVVVASESNTAPTVDADTTNGSWVSSNAVSAGSGSDATKMSVLLQYKIVTGAGTQLASAACTNSDWAVVWAMFTVPATKSDADTGTGADAGETVAVTNPKTDTEAGAAADTEAVAAFIAISDDERVVVAESVPPAGYMAWWDADDPTTIHATGSVLNTWDDKSGNGYTVTANGTVATGTRTMGGRNVLDCNGSTGPMSAAIAALTAVPFTVVAVWQTDTPSSDQHVTFGAGTALGSGTLMITSTSGGFWYYWNGVYAGSSGPATNTSPHVLLGLFNGASSKLYLDGTDITTDPNPGSRDLTSPITIGNQVDGAIAEILIYPSALSGAQITALSNYLMVKWGLASGVVDRESVSISAGTTPTDSDVGVGVDGTISPLQLPVLRAWWDAADTSSITSSAGLTSQINDKSPLGNHLIAAFAGRPTTGVDTVNGLNALLFDGVANLMNVTALSSEPTVGAVRTVFMVVRPNTTSGYRTIIGGNGSNSLQIRQPTAAEKAEILKSSVASLVTGTADDGVNNATQITAEYITATSATLWRDGVLDATASHAQTIGSGLNVAVGASSGAELYSGDICEIIICDIAVPAVLRQAVESYLCQKWGISTSLTPAESLATALTNTETGAGVDAELTLATALTDTETAAVVDTESVSVGGPTPINDSDTASSADAGEAIAAALSVSEVGAGVDNGAIATTLSDTETGSGVDAGEALSDSLLDTEVGSGNDAGESISSVASDADTGTAADAVGSIGLTDPDVGGGVDGEAIAASVVDSDTASALDTESVNAGGLVSLSDADTGAGVDAGEALADTLTDADSAAAADTELSLTAGVTNTEVGTVVDLESVAAALSDSDLASGVDAEAAATSLTDPDTGTAVDSALSVQLSSSDSAIGVDAEFTLVAALTDSDFATVADFESVGAALADADTAIVADAVALLSLMLTDSDFGTVVETEFVTQLLFNNLAMIVGRILPGWRLISVGPGWQAGRLGQEWRLIRTARSWRLTKVEQGQELD